MCPRNCTLTSMAADKFVSPEMKNIEILINEFINPPCKSNAISCREQWFLKKKKQGLHPFWRDSWNCGGRRVGDWRRSCREKCVPWSLLCPHFWCSGARRNEACSESARTVGRRSHCWVRASIWCRRWGWGYICGRGWRWAERWGQGVWKVDMHGCTGACQSSLRETFGGCRQSIRTVIVLALIPQFR